MIVINDKEDESVKKFHTYEMELTMHYNDKLNEKELSCLLERLKGLEGLVYFSNKWNCKHKSIK